MLKIPLKSKLLAVGVCGTMCYPLGLLALHPPYAKKTPHPDKTVIITGATGNIGRATAFHYALRQCRVIMACRDMQKCKAFRRELIVETDNKSLVCRHLDLEDVDSINDFVDHVTATEPHIDVLVNNAAVRLTGPEELTKYGLEKHLFVNFIAPYLLTLRLLPKLEESAATQNQSRIVNVVGKPKKFWRLDLDDLNFEKRSYSNKKAYGQSKLAFAYFTITLDKILRERKSRVLVFANGFNANRIHKSFDRDHSEHWRLFIRLRRYFYSDPLNLCGATVYCGLDPELGIQESGGLFKLLYQTYGRNKGWGWVGRDEYVAKRVWNFANNFLTSLPDPKSGPEKVSDDRPKSDEVEAVQ